MACMTCGACTYDMCSECVKALPPSGKRAAGSPAMWPSKCWQYMHHAFAHAETDALEHGQKDMLDDAIIELENRASKRMKGITMASGSNAQRRQLQANNFKKVGVSAQALSEKQVGKMSSAHLPFADSLSEKKRMAAAAQQTARGVKRDDTEKEVGKWSQAVKEQRREGGGSRDAQSERCAPVVLKRLHRSNRDYYSCSTLYHLMEVQSLAHVM